MTWQPKGLEAQTVGKLRLWLETLKISSTVPKQRGPGPKTLATLGQDLGNSRQTKELGPMAAGVYDPPEHLKILSIVPDKFMIWSTVHRQRGCYLRLWPLLGKIPGTAHKQRGPNPLPPGGIGIPEKTLRARARSLSKGNPAHKEGGPGHWDTGEEP